MTGQLGVGVMLKHLGGNEDSVNAWIASANKEIAALVLVDGLLFTFSDGTQMMISDEGQSCCEYRYMTTDDDLSYYVGATLLDTEILDAPDIEAEYGDHEVQFLRVATSRGVFTMETHNEHNGYYGGFAIRCALV